MKACVICNTALTGRQSKYCSPLCLSRGFNEARRSDGRLVAQRAALKESRAAWQRENRSRYVGRYTETRTCDSCASEFTVRAHERTQTCSQICKTRQMFGSWPQSKLPWVTCPDCGDRRMSRSGGSPRCSDCYTPTVRKSWIGRARRQSLYQRDGWTCQLCTGPVDPELPPLDNWAASLDHIIPRSRGGDHSDENLRLAHRWCNSVRGDDTYYTAADLVA